MRVKSIQPSTWELQPWIDALSTPLNTDVVQLVWVGQAGFLIQSAAATIGIDLYLSDSLAEKYQGSLFPHTRMAPSPCRGSDLRSLDLVLSSHGHTDHLDPDTLGEIFQAEGKEQPLLICPRSEMAKAKQRNVPLERIVGLGHGECYAPSAGIAIHAIAAAHETLQEDGFGNSYYLGYIIEIGELKIYHGGDCVPYDGLSSLLRSYKIDLALLPVNGRDAYRKEHGIAGNFTMAEAITLCEEAGIPCLIPHHYGMFDFNTVSVSEIEAVIEEQQDSPVSVVLIEVGDVMDLHLTTSAADYK